MENALISRRRRRFVRTLSQGGGVSQEAPGTVQSEPSVSPIKRGWTQAGERPLGAPNPLPYPFVPPKNLIDRESAHLPPHPPKSEEEQRGCHSKKTRVDGCFLFVCLFVVVVLLPSSLDCANLPPETELWTCRLIDTHTHTHQETHTKRHTLIEIRSPVET